MCVCVCVCVCVYFHCLISANEELLVLNMYLKICTCIVKLSVAHSFSPYTGFMPYTHKQEEYLNDQKLF